MTDTSSHEPPVESAPELKVYLALCDRAVEPLATGLDEELAREWERLGRRINEGVREALQRAYMSGVRDGFVQGVQAQAEKQAPL